MHPLGDVINTYSSTPRKLWKNRNLVGNGVSGAAARTGNFKEKESKKYIEKEIG